jgi:twitching motility protein PilT
MGQGNAKLLGINKLLEQTINEGASDLHILPDVAPYMRIQGKLKPISSEAVSVEQRHGLAKELGLSEKQQEQLRQKKGLDFAYALPNGERFRVGAVFSQGSPSYTFRHILSKVPGFKTLGFPEKLAEDLINTKDGLIIVTGSIGMGKTTTLASLLDHTNRTETRKIYTIEDPIEFTHTPNKSVFVQREVCRDTDTFYDALREGLRHDCDTFLVGEVRDRETAALTLSAAEIGRLVYATVHARDTCGAITRFTDFFKAEQESMTTQFSLSLRYIIAQILVPNEKGERVLALEVMKPTEGMAEKIRNRRIHQIYSDLQSGRSRGMWTMDMNLAELVKAGRLTREAAIKHTRYPSEFKQHLSTYNIRRM